MRLFLQGLSLLLLGIVFSGYTHAQFVVPAYQGYVTDYADILSDSDKIHLNEKIVSLEKETSTEIAVLFVSTVNDEDIAFAATQVGHTRGVGKEKEDNGVMLLIAVDDKEWYIAIGYGLEGTIPDAIAKRVGERHFPGYFRAGDYIGGVTAVLDDISAYILADPTVVTAYNADDTSVDADDSDVRWFAAIFSFIFLLSVRLPKSKKVQSKIIKTSVWIGLIFILSFLVASIALALLYVSFFGLFFIIKTGPGMLMGGGRTGGFGSGGFGGGGGFGGFGGGGFGGGGAGGRR